MKDERMESLLEEGFATIDTTPEDVERSTRRVMERKSRVRQRSRWWPFPVIHRRTQAPTTHETHEYQSSPTPATNGRSPIVIGRTQSMLSPVKAITAGAIILALGAAFVVAQPFQQQDSAPGAELGAFPTPDRFTSFYRWSGQTTAGASETLDGDIEVVSGEGWLFDFDESTDDRFAGPLVLTNNVVHHPRQGNLMYGGYRIETADGAWQQLPVAGVRLEEDLLDWRNGVKRPANNVRSGTFMGEGAYDGLVAVFQETWWPDGTQGLIQLDGWVIDGDLPDAPDPWVP